LAFYTSVLSKDDKNKFKKKLEKDLKNENLNPSFYEFKLRNLDWIEEENKKLVRRMKEFQDYVLKRNIGYVNERNGITEIEIIKGFYFL
jgi:hypothetical protein